MRELTQALVRISSRAGIDPTTASSTYSPAGRGITAWPHLAIRLTASTEQLHGSLVLLFDLDEDTGRFGGARQYFEGPDAPNDIAGPTL